MTYFIRLNYVFFFDWVKCILIHLKKYFIITFIIINWKSENKIPPRVPGSSMPHCAYCLLLSVVTDEMSHKN